MDVYETQHLYGFQPRFVSEHVNVDLGSFKYYGGTDNLQYSLSIADILLFRLKARDPQRWAQYRETLQSFAQETLFMAQGKLEGVDDQGAYSAGWNCELKQLIVQRRDSLDGKVYVIDLDLWMQLPNDIQATAILHEVIYRNVLKVNPNIKNSEDVRHLNALIIGDQLQTIPESAYNLLVEKLDAPKTGLE